MHHLAITGLEAHYGRLKVLDDISLTIDRGEIIGLMGPSGSGKSSILRVLMGLTPMTEGRVELDGATIDYNNAQSLKGFREKAAIVFQQYNLFQNMTVLDNVTVTPVKIRGRPQADVEREAKDILAKVGLGDKLKSYPDQLSGGQQQRVALARALALKPEILLLDEVTAALDPELVSEVLDTIRVLAGEGMTMLIVSHEMGFIQEISNRVIFMDSGKIVEQGPPVKLFSAPQEARTREFVSKILKH